jgi:hypothetical protein
VGGWLLIMLARRVVEYVEGGLEGEVGRAGQEEIGGSDVISARFT